MTKTNEAAASARFSPGIEIDGVGHVAEPPRWHIEAMVGTFPPARIPESDGVGVRNASQTQTCCAKSLTALPAGE
jgi:hypothetical protein